MKIAFLGGGFIASHLISKLIAQNHTISVLTRSIPLVSHPCENLRFVQLNRKDLSSLHKELAQQTYDVLYDFCAFAPSHVRSLLPLLPSQTRYIFLSSAAVYGPRARTEVTETSQPLALKHKYAYNKWRAEEETKRFSHLPTVIVRPNLVIGPYDSQPQLGAYFFRRIYQSVPILFPGSIEVQNHFIDVADLANLLLLSLKAPAGSIFNAAGPTFTWYEYLCTLAQVMKCPLPSYCCLGMDLEEFRNWPQAKKLHFHHNCFFDFTLSTTRAQQQLGWAPELTLRESLARIWPWLQQNASQFLAFDVDLNLERQIFLMNRRNYGKKEKE